MDRACAFSGGLRGLARGGVYRAIVVTNNPVRSYHTFSPLPVPASGPLAVHFLWHFP